MSIEKFDSKCMQSLPNPLRKYEGITRYKSATTVEHTGRLHLNENAFGPSPKCLEALRCITEHDLYEYDQSPSDFLAAAISEAFSIPEDAVFVHAGSAEIIKTIISLCVERGDTILVSDPGWSYYASLTVERFGNVVSYNLYPDGNEYVFDTEDILAKAKLYAPKVIVLNVPHNPTGAVMDENMIETVLQQNPDSLVHLDLAYYGFSENCIDIRRFVETYTNLIVTGTFSKLYGLASVRIGYAFCHPQVRHIFELDLPLFKVDYVSRRIAEAALRDRIYYATMVQKLVKSRARFIEAINSINKVRAYRSSANFVLVSFEDVDVYRLEEYLRYNGIRILVCEIRGTAMARISIADQEVMHKCYELIRAFINR